MDGAVGAAAVRVSDAPKEAEEEEQAGMFVLS